MKALVVALFVALCAGVGAKEPPPPFEHTRPDPSLTLVSKSDLSSTGYRAVWRGKVWLTGKLVVEYCPLQACSTDLEEEGRVFFEPDPVSEAKLPAATSWFYPRPANLVVFDRLPLNVLMLLLGKDRGIEVHLAKPKRHEYRVRILLSEFSTVIDCNARHYMLRFEKLELLAPDVVAYDASKRLTCAG
jgi:hypothetical protein